MEKYRLLVKPSAAAEIATVGAKVDRRSMVWKIARLSAEPRPGGAEKLAGYDDRYRVRQGKYRIAYLIDDFRLEVTIFTIGHRQDAYR